MYEIEMALGNRHAVDMCGAADGFLHIHITDGESFADVVTEFSNQEETQEITYLYGEMLTVHRGYTQLVCAEWNGGTRYRVIQQKKTE